MNPPFFSIIIPAFNRAHTIERCLKSIFEQNIHSYEILVLDDGSTDATKEVLQPFMNQIRYLPSEENLGPNIRKNQGAREAEGQWLIFLDSDDELTPGALEHLQSCTEKTSATLIMSSSKNASGKILSTHPGWYGELSGEEYLREDIRGEYLPMVAREAFLKSSGFFEDIRGGEGLTWKKIALEIGKVWFSSFVTRLYDDTGSDRLSIKSGNFGRLSQVLKKDLELYSDQYRAHRPLLLLQKMLKQRYYQLRS